MQGFLQFKKVVLYGKKKVIKSFYLTMENEYLSGESSEFFVA